MGKKRHDIRITLTEEDKKTYEALKKETGIKSDTDLVRFAFTKLLTHLKKLNK